ncbi:cation diffusion facilitator 10 [Colletotrichum karsti]|uniref:Cation diffusion facilitator 10 n=1 Tax=Colletotrichum karsti TaxID=1095194 RepID=A0A9P6LE53_9PEZI|nr:cation diffusion facilitator 10 [Colletotrichum karsti]KAF9869998.1 cation diffusion facilitator 10 [Colletotrichum karsti]
MSSPQHQPHPHPHPHPSGSPRVGSFKRPSVLNPDHDPSLLVTRGNGALVSLIRNRSNATLRESLKSPGLHHDDEEAALENQSLLGFLHRDSDDDHRRSAAEERRLSEIIFGPQMRSMRLIGNSNPRYQWERYWKTEAELQKMSKPIREYYERNNDLIRMYLFIDQLLDSSVPHDLLNEYHQALDASAYRPVDVPQTITEESPTPTSPPSRGGPGYGSTASVPNSSTEHSSSANSIQQKVKRTPKDIFRPTESTPLLTLNGHDEEEGLAEDPDAPKPEIPWLEDGDIDSSDPIVTLAIWVNFIANGFLLLGKIIVVFSVPSVSVLASLVDAVLDFLSTAIVWTTTRLIAASQNDQHSYPVGRQRLEPLGVLVFSIVMVTSFCQVALEAIQRLMSPEHEIIQLGIPAIAIMVGTVVIKGLCWLWCRLIKNSSVRALADDAMTDVIFNTGSILFPIVGFYAKIWWLDALGGLLLSFVVIVNWSQTSAHHVRNLTGFSATSDERNLLLYLTMRFATSIKQIQNLRAYHAGDKLFVEVDIVLSANMPLKDSHDLSEVLTYFLESVPIVDRAFVHVDYATYNVDTHITQ